MLMAIASLASCCLAEGAPATERVEASGSASPGPAFFSRSDPARSTIVSFDLSDRRGGGRLVTGRGFTCGRGCRGTAEGEAGDGPRLVSGCVGKTTSGPGSAGLLRATRTLRAERAFASRKKRSDPDATCGAGARAQKETERPGRGGSLDPPPTRLDLARNGRIRTLRKQKKRPLHGGAFCPPTDPCGGA